MYKDQIFWEDYRNLKKFPPCFVKTEGPNVCWHALFWILILNFNQLPAGEKWSQLTFGPSCFVSAWSNFKTSKDIFCGLLTISKPEFLQRSLKKWMDHFTSLILIFFEMSLNMGHEQYISLSISHMIGSVIYSFE